MDPHSQTASVDDLLAHVGWVQALARSLVRDAATADDLAQETWMAALTGTRATNESPRGWLGRVLRNRLLQRARSERTRSDHELREPPEPDLPSSDDLLERIEQQKLLAEALVSLREPFRESVILRYYEGLNATEIGERLGESPGTIRQRLKRGLEALREDLDQRVDGGREAWLSFLLPLVGAGRSGSIPFDPVGAGAGSALIGAVTLKKLAMIAAVLLVAGSAAYWWEELASEPTPLPQFEEASLLASPLTPAENEAAFEDAQEPRAPVETALDNRRAVEASPLSIAEASMTGRVSWPEQGAAFDETLQVFALSEALQYDAFIDGGGSLSSERILASTLVTEEGEFSFRFEEEPESVHLMVRGRHLYLEETVEVVLGGVPMVVLSPVCGAWIHGRVSAPPDSLAATENGLVGARIQLLTDSIFGQENGVPDSYTSVVDESGRFELRAIVGNSGAKLFATADSLAAQLVALEDFEPCAELTVDIQLLLGGGVRGHVVDDRGAAVAGALLRSILPGQYLGFDDNLVGQTTTDEQGEFALDHLPPGNLFLAAFRDGYLDSEKLEVTIQNREVRDGAELVVSSGNWLRGRVVFEDGASAGGVALQVEFDQAYQVGISAFNALRGARGSARTQSDGSFEVTGLGAGPFVVTATHESGELAFSARLDAVQPNSEDLELVLRGPLELRGVVATESGLPVSAFEVRAVRTVAGAIGETATSSRSTNFESKDGSFVLGDLTEGRWRLEVSAEGFARSEPQAIELPTTDSLAFVLTSPATIQGFVLDPDGEYAVDARVSVETGQSKWQAQFAKASEVPSARTDERGRFILTGVRAGEVLISAIAEGHAKSSPITVSVGPGEAKRGVPLQLSRGGRITGEILEEGEPAADRVITLVQWQRDAFDTSLAESDADGRFEFNNVEPGLWTVVVMDLKADWSSTDKGDSMAQRMGSMKSAQVRVQEGSEDHVVLGEAPKSTIVLNGRVTRGDEPYVGAMVLVSSVEAGFSAESETTAVDEKGEYSVTLDGPGNYQLRVSRMGRASGEVSVFSYVHELEDEPEVVIDIEIPGGGLAGIVLDEAGEPLAGVGVALVPGSGASLGQVFARRFMQTSTDADGRFEVPDLAAGEYQLTTSPLGELAGTKLDGITLGRDQWRRELELRVPRAGSVEVRVTDNLGRACAGASIFARDRSGAVVEAVSPAMTDDSGSALYPGLAPGTYSFFARSAEFVSTHEVAVRVESGESSSIELPVEVGSFLIVSAKENRVVVPTSFLVEDEEGRDVSNLFATPFEAQETWLAGLAGQRRIGPLPAGKYSVTGIASSGSSTQKWVTLQANAERRLVLRL